MGQYSDIIKNREYQDRKSAELSELFLLGENQNNKSYQSYIADDVLAALEYILSRYGKKANRIADCRTVREILECTLEPVGILYEQINVSEKIGEQGDCILAFTENGSSIVITKSLLGYKYYIPAVGKQGILNKKIKLKPEAYVINRPISAGEFSIYSFARFVTELITPREWLLIGTASLLIALFGIIVPEINRIVLGRYIEMPLKNALPLLMFACLGMAIVYIIRTLLRCIREILTASVCLHTQQKVEAAFLGRILLLPMEYFQENTSGRISSSIIFSKELSEIVVSAIVGTSITTFFSLAYIGEMANISVELLVMSLLLLFVSLSMSIITNIVSMANERKQIESESQLRDYNYMVFKGIEKIKTVGAENRIYSDWAWMFRSNLKYTYDPPLLVKMKPTIDVFIVAGGTVLLLLAAASVKLPASEYIAFMSVYGMLSATVDQIALLSEKGTVAGTYIERLKPILDSSWIDDNAGQGNVRNLIGGVHFDNVCMSYKDNDNFKIENLSLTIKPGEKIGIVGHSGCGKSSLINLLTGINKATSGEIFIDGKSIKNINQRSLNRQIGSVSQFSRLFPGTVRFNVNLGDENITDEEIWKALDDAEIGDLIRSYPNGLETEVSENQSGGFSGGQRQRLLLARSFLGSHSLIILDEATSALDNITQRKVLSNIYDMGTTVIMIAHRLSTITRCDRIYVMDNGKIVEEGTYDSLIKNRGLFYELVEKQLQGEDIIE